MSLKLDHIPILEGPANYSQWERALTRTLRGEGLWGYVNDVNDITSPWNQIPCPTFDNPTTAQRRAITEWWQMDAKAKDIIERRLSNVILSILPNDDLTVSREIWSTLKTRFGRVDVTAQFDLRTRISEAKLKDHNDLDAYIGEFKTARAQFINMGVAFSEDEMVHLIIRGLPSTDVWPSIKAILTQLVQDHKDATAGAAIPLAPDTLLNRITSRISTECNRLASERPISTPLSPSPVVPPPTGIQGPGSEFVNFVTVPIRKHPRNPNGVLCSNCNSISHDCDHCYSKGGGMQGQNWQPKKARDAAALAMTYSSAVGDLSC